jgi:hypothetical protein
MRPDDLRQYLDQQPSQPLRIHLSSGAFFDIRQPELTNVTRSTLNIGLPLEGNLRSFVDIALVHIVWLEVLVPTLEAEA